MKAQGLNSDPWSCSVSAAIGDVFGVGTQLRVRRNKDQMAIYTVAEIREQDPANMVRMSSIARQRLGTSDTFSGTLHTPLSTKLMTDAQAESSGAFVERLADAKDHQGLVVMAPHGGRIEFNTDLQARWVAQALAGGDVSTWCCSGWRTDNGNTHSRWHVSTTDISPASFPGLATIADRGFAYAVAFHGMKANGVLIGGGAPNELKQLIRQAIKSEVGNNPVTVVNGGKNSGVSETNVVNWITAGGGGGVHIEQSSQVREKYWKPVAQAVADVFADLI
ncbi:poly-gamma-glutamate hydrolase family protein [Enhygromyxa salina]|nr:poly-gamma-glutamate hydrolase family protein [Enhygromyxa salina]